MTETKAPPQIDPDLPPADPERVALMMAVDDQEDLLGAWRNRTLTRDGGTPLTDQEYEQFGQAGHNDIAAMLQMSYQEVQIAGERAKVAQLMYALMAAYGFGAAEHGGENDTVGACRSRMKPDDQRRLDELGEIAFPDGYYYPGL